MSCRPQFAPIPRHTKGVKTVLTAPLLTLAIKENIGATKDKARQLFVKDICYVAEIALQS